MSPVNCHVYKSLRREDTYVYLARRDDFERLPPAMREVLLPLAFVLALDLHAGRRLARENPLTVIDNLRSQGFHLQWPPAAERHVGDPPGRD